MSKITIHNISGEDIKVWHPNKRHDNPCYQISMESGGWLCGAYDSEEAALMGAEQDLKLNPAFYAMQKRVNYYDMENRLITIDDFEVVK